MGYLNRGKSDGVLFGVEAIPDRDLRRAFDVPLMVKIADRQKPSIMTIADTKPVFIDPMLPETGLYQIRGKFRRIGQTPEAQYPIRILFFQHAAFPACTPKKTPISILFALIFQFPKRLNFILKQNVVH